MFRDVVDGQRATRSKTREVHRYKNWLQNKSATIIVLNEERTRCHNGIMTCIDVDGLVEREQCRVGDYCGINS